MTEKTDKKSLKDKLHLDSHHKIERFGVMFLSCFLCLVIVVGMCGAKSINDSIERLGDNVIYTTEFVTTKTGVIGTVENVFVSDDKTKTMVLLHFSDMTNLSRDASDYRIFLTGSDTKQKEHALTYTPSACIYMFGQTGYMGLYFVNAAGFDNQILKVMVQNMGMLLSSDDSGESTETYDYLTLYFNPGGAAYTTVDFLNNDANKGTFALYDMYAQMITKPQEIELKKQLDADVKALHNGVANIVNCRKNLELDGIVVPESPTCISGDTFDTDDNGVITFKPKHILAKGYDYDWRWGTMNGGYLNKLIDNPTQDDYVNYILQHDKDETEDGFSNAGVEFYLKNGTAVADLDVGDETIGNYSKLSADCQALLSAWESYYNAKKQYQCVDLRQLLVLEAQARSAGYDATINAEDGVLTCY